MRHARYFVPGFIGASLCLLLIVSWSFAADMSFQEALGKLRERNESLKAAQNSTDQKRYERDAARGLYFPKIQLGMKYVRIDDPIVIDLDDIRSVMLSLHPAVPSRRVPSFKMTVQDDLFLKANINATWPIFTGGQIIAANKAAESFLVDAKEKQRSVESALTSDLVKLYFGLGLAKQVTLLRKDVLAGIEQHLSRARSLEENGMISRGERLHAEVAKSEADRELRRAVHDEGLADTALKSILAEEETINPVSEPFIIKQIESLEHFRSLALSDNPVLKQIEAQRNAAHQAYRKEVGSLLPQIFLFGQKELHQKDLTLLEPQWSVGVGLNFTIFEGGARLNRISAAQSVETRVSHLESQAKRNMESLVQKKYQQLAKALEQHETLGTALVTSQEHLRIRTRSFEEGYATSLDVVDAQLALSRVKLERLVAVYDFDVALAELLEACGASTQFEEYRSRSGREVLF